MDCWNWYGAILSAMFRYHAETSALEVCALYTVAAPAPQLKTKSSSEGPIISLNALFWARQPLCSLGFLCAKLGVMK